MNNAFNKIFIIGLPRTGTTSLCATMLDLGYKTAHTAYTHKAFEYAQVIADTPVFCDYQKLDKQYPNSKFIYLTRQSDLWLPSIKQLLQRMIINVNRDDGGFNPIIKKCFKEIFQPFTEKNIASDAFLLGCYEKHKVDITQYFSHCSEKLLTINLSENGSYQQLLNFLEIPEHLRGDFQKEQHVFKRLNVGGKVTAWQKIKHPLKVESTNHGKIDKL